MQIGDLKGFFGLIAVNLQLLRTKLKVLDATYGIGTGGWLWCFPTVWFWLSPVFFLNSHRLTGDVKV